MKREGSFYERVVIMTTKHVVADALLGQVARKQWELNRRVLEGTLDPQTLLHSLQQLIEGKLIEKVGFTIAEVYSVEVQRNGKFEDVFRTSTSIHDYFQAYHRPPTCWIQIPNGSGPKKVSLSLALFTRNHSFGAAINSLETEGYTLADAWDLLAFAKKAEIFKTIPVEETCIYVFGTTAISRFRESPRKLSEWHIVYAISRQKGYAGKQYARWELSTSSLESIVGRGVVEAGQYVLVRRK